MNYDMFVSSAAAVLGYVKDVTEKSWPDYVFSMQLNWYIFIAILCLLFIVGIIGLLYGLKIRKQEIKNEIVYSTYGTWIGISCVLIGMPILLILFSASTIFMWINHPDFMTLKHLVGK